MVSLVAVGAISAAAFGGVAAATGGPSGTDGTDSTSVAIAQPLEISQPLEIEGLTASQAGLAAAANPLAVSFNGERERPRGPRARHAGLELVEFLGIEPAELRQRIAGGETPAQIAESVGSSGQAIVDVIVAGDLPQAVADARLAQITERATTFVNEGPQPRDGRPGRRHHGPARLIHGIAGFIGIEPQTLFEGIQGGDTIAIIADANGSSGQSIVDELLTRVTERLDEALANGRITPAERDEHLANATESIQTLVFDTPQPGERPSCDAARGAVSHAMSDA